MRHSLAVGAAILSALLATNSSEASQQPSLETRAGTAQPVQNPQFTNLYRKIQSLEDRFYQSRFDGDKVATEEAKVNRTIAKIAAGDISGYLNQLGMANYNPIAAFTYRGEIILDARERSSADNEEGAWIKINSTGVNISLYRNIGGMPRIVAPEKLETPLPGFDEILKTVQYADAEHGKLRDITYSSTKLQYIRSLTRDLGVQIAKKCGLDTFMEFAPEDAHAIGNDTIKVDAGRLVFYSDVGHWEPSNLTLSRNGKVTHSIPTGYGNFKTASLECKP